MRATKPYAEYKDSGIEWLGQIPSHWETRRLKDVGVLIAGSGFPHEYQGIQGEDLQFYKVADLAASSDGMTMHEGRNSISREIAAQLRASVIPAGSLLWAKIGAALFLNRRRITARPCCIDNNMTAYVPDRERASTDWAFFWTSTLDFGELANPGAVPSLSEGYQSTLPFILPPLDEQEAIADFLDRETAKIDALVEKKGWLIELLQEKRTALITHAVTKGLDPNVPMKDSGIEWLGEIPAHWDTHRLKLVATINDEVLPEDTDPDYEISYLDIGNVDATKGIVAKEMYRFADAPSRARRVVRDGDVVVSTVRTYLRAIAPIVNPEQNVIVSTGFAVIRPRSSLKSDFASYALRALYFVDHVVAESVGVSYPAINAWQLGTFRIALPTEAEQHSIADFLTRETARIDALITKIQEAIERLKEYRTALISAAVTGKIDLREEVLSADT